ncbi:MAG: transcription-repair coupling factor [Clostridia bacterium]|nr:transcription-repair coupling factor [Clostridia bacterium]
MLLGDLSCSFLYIAKDEETAKSVCLDIYGFTGEECIFLPSREFLFHKIDNFSREFEQKKINALWQIANNKSRMIVTTPDALMSRCIPLDVLIKNTFELKDGQEYSTNDILTSLVRMGYKRYSAVEGVGQYAQRGDIVDIFPINSINPVRIEFFGDEIDSMNYFDISSQRRIEKISEINILPVDEVVYNDEELAGIIDNILPEIKNEKLRLRLTEDKELLTNKSCISNADVYADVLYKNIATALDYLPENLVVIIDDSMAVMEGIKGYEYRMKEGVEDHLNAGNLIPGHCDFFIDESRFTDFIKRRKSIFLDSFLTGSMLPPKEILSVSAKQLPAYGGSFDVAASDMESYSARDYITFIMTGNEKRAANMKKILSDRGICAEDVSNDVHEGKIYLVPESISYGFEYPSVKVAVISEGQISGPKRKSAPKSKKNRIQSFTDLSIGDVVVHEQHGIGRFAAMEKIVQDGIERDYMKIAFAGTDCIYVPATALGMISKYIGVAEDGAVKLSKLGGMSWEKAKAKAKSSAKDLAQYLIGLYAKRKETKGFAFEPDSDWQSNFESRFEYEETPDQLAAAREIKDDMESPYPMDRLLCGDVGFGKTEVAFRAIMKCILSGKQAAILVPTTVLARQHYLTAKSRFAGYPIEIDTLSRFRKPKQQKEICAKLKTGEIDLVIGTHRLLQKDVKFKDLGLLVVDEEQRFGVSHKEKIKEMSIGIDVLTLSATPIPRTLNMALSGIRDMSVLEEAPRDRMPVQTYVLEHNDEIIFDAISKEISRGGQVYYLHNRVESIEGVCQKIRKRFPDITVDSAHGKMDEEQLSDKMNRLYNGEIQVLVCTTIIETGIDVSNVNTIIIENADHMGLSQLHQIRGRVGRSHRHAYAYLTYRRGKVLSEISQKRLSAMREFAEFGAGFKIAMRDLEIRGAGNLLGGEQSGHMMSVGYDMYLKLLEEAVNELSDNPKSAKIEAHIDIVTDAILPERYVSSAEQRIDLYRRIGQVQNIDEYQDMLDELIDRFGEPPKQAVTLLSVALLRANAAEVGISEIVQKKDKLIIHFAVSDVEKAIKIASHDRFKRKIIFNATGAPYVTVTIEKKETSLKVAEDFVRIYREI